MRCQPSRSLRLAPIIVELASATQTWSKHQRRQPHQPQRNESLLIAILIPIKHIAYTDLTIDLTTVPSDVLSHKRRGSGWSTCSRQQAPPSPNLQREHHITTESEETTRQHRSTNVHSGWRCRDEAEEGIHCVISSCPQREP